MTRDEIIGAIEEIEGEDNKILLADGFEDAFVGIGRQYTSPPLAVYDRNKCIQILIRDGMSEEEAEEYFQFNVDCAWVGENTPLFLQPLNFTEELKKLC